METTENEENSAESSKKKNWLAAVLAVIIPLSTFIHGMFQVYIEDRRKERELALEREKQLSQTRISYLDRALMPEQKAIHKETVLKFLVATMTEDDPLKQWAEEELEATNEALRLSRETLNSAIQLNAAKAKLAAIKRQQETTIRERVEAQTAVRELEQREAELRKELRAAENKASVSSENPASCYRVKPSKPLLGPTSGVWSSDGSTLLIADALAEEILSISPKGEVSSSTPNMLIRPQLIRRNFDGSYFFEDLGRQAILDFNARFEVSFNLKKETKLQNAPFGEVELVALYNWISLESGFLAFGDLKTPKTTDGPAEHRSSFVYFNRSLEEFFGPPISIDNAARQHYVHNSSYISSIDGTTAHILRLEAPPSIHRFDLIEKTISKLPLFPEDLTAMPQFLRNNTTSGRRNATEYYKKVEASKMATGLYSWGGQLFLLAKEPIAPDNTTQWWLLSLAPDTGSELSRFPLPSSAAHLTLITGEILALIERAPVEGLDESSSPFMETSSILFLPTSQLEYLAGTTVASDLQCQTLG